MENQKIGNDSYEGFESASNLEMVIDSSSGLNFASLYRLVASSHVIVGSFTLRPSTNRCRSSTPSFIKFSPKLNRVCG